MAKILIIDDDRLFCDALTDIIAGDDHEIHCAYTLEGGVAMAASGAFDVVILDVLLPDGNGLERISEIRATSSYPEVIILTGAVTAKNAEMAIESGAWDYITKPSPISDMRFTLLRTLQYRAEKQKKRPADAFRMEHIVGRSPKMKDCYDLVADAAVTDINVLITGETGTGKELFARAIHDYSRRSGKNFVVVDCAALHDTLSESILFGYEKGAFTGALESREGLIKQSDGGTLFLDEVGELPLPLQKVFLRVLQERRFRPLGFKKELESNFRLIAATNRNLDEMVRSGQFREDLFYRLRAFSIALPPLREHKEDILAIASYHVARICERSGLKDKSFSPDFSDALLAYPWPGNVRELVNAVERAVTTAGSASTLFQRHLPSQIRVRLAQTSVAAGPSHAAAVRPGNLPTLKELRDSIYREAERNYLENLLAKTSGNIGQACRIAGLSRPRLYELFRKHNMTTKI